MQNQQPHNSLTLQLKRPLADNGSRKRPPVFNVNRKRQHVANESKKRLQDANRKRPHVFNGSRKRLQDANRKRPLVFSVSRKRPQPASVLMSNSRLISSRLTSSLTTRLAHKALVCPPFRHSHQRQAAVPTSP